MTSSKVKLPDGPLSTCAPRWSNKPEDLQDCADDFLWALTGEEEDSKGIVNPLLFHNDGTCSYLVEYPTNSREYYMYSAVSGEIWKIERPTKLDDIIEELGKKSSNAIDMKLEGEQKVKLPDGPHWRNKPEDLEDCKDEFICAITGVDPDFNGQVKPLLYRNDGSCSYLVEYPTDSREYYMFCAISEEIWKIHRPTRLDDIIVELGKPKWVGIDMRSLWGEHGTKVVDLDEWKQKQK
ncbi:MAG: hypothetical protein Q9178_000487 [Gyalolechia marmorata]